ncbi:MAG: hypothetical protein LBS70_10585, partial [Candidatus Accumulibacter sp.]|nr:hypothetical protein [Accumulibacter sp.]
FSPCSPWLKKPPKQQQAQFFHDFYVKFVIQQYVMCYSSCNPSQSPGVGVLMVGAAGVGAAGGGWGGWGRMRVSFLG